MVYLSKIYTKTGDDGETMLGDGSPVHKDDARIEAYGTVDELNSAVGLLLASNDDLRERELLESITNDLFDVGADLCVPQLQSEQAGAGLRVTMDQAARLERVIDRLNEPLEPLTSFILPGGTKAAAGCHLARTICRRAERRVCTLSHHAPINPAVLIYLNRLSDLLFVLCRVYNQERGDVLWRPGGTQQANPSAPPAGS